MDRNFEITAHRVDVVAGRIAPETVLVRDGIIQSIEPAKAEGAEAYLLPGFVDAHVHIESSMLMPGEFARAAVVHGTVATVSDPHEIANVCGIEGVELMLRDAERTCFKFHFGAPSCVPATEFETAGATLDVEAVASLLDDPRINHLSEMMNFPGVIAGRPEVMAKIDAARQRGLPVDGHAPGLRGDEMLRYFRAGISTDHECVSLEEATEKLETGCRIAIREGSAAKNFEALWPLIDRHPDSCMFCSDDKHPDDLLIGHINQLVARAVARGSDLMKTLRVACLNPVRHYAMNVGLLQLGDPADFVMTRDLTTFKVDETYINGQLVASHGKPLLPPTSPQILNRFAACPIQAASLQIPARSPRIRVMEVLDGQLITGAATDKAVIEDGLAVASSERDLLKLVVVNRYQEAQPAVAFVRGFGLARGAIASSVAHDSHNIVAVGASDVEIVAAVNRVIDQSGGLVIACDQEIEVLQLPVAGLMSLESCDIVAHAYASLDRQAKELGCGLASPFMTLSFLALPVIPTLKLTDRGLFDVDRFEFVSLFV